MHKNEKRPGYKKTKVGWIPDGWKCSTFGETFQIQLGKMLNKQASAGPSQQPYLTNINVRWGSFDVSNIRTMFFSDKEKAKFALKQGDLLVCEGGDIGRCAVWQEDIEPCYYQKAIHRLRPNKKCVDVRFAMYFLHQAFTSSRVQGLVGETSFAHFTRERFIEFPISVPPLFEQIAIAEVLECWVKVIRNLELKISKKRQIKKGLTQQLLSGHSRLPGFSKPWKNIRLGNVFNLIATYAFSRENLTTEDVDNCAIYNIHYGDIHATYTGAVLDLCKERRVPMLITSEELPSTLEFLKDGDLIMADVSEDYEGIGVCIELKNIDARKVTGGLHTFVLRDSTGYTAVGFRGYLFKEYGLAKELKRIATGVSVYSLSKSNLTEVKLHLPPLEEQRAIAKILATADGEIETLERKLALLNDQKKYLLNNLVTGTIRLPEFRKCLP